MAREQDARHRRADRECAAADGVEHAFEGVRGPTDRVEPHRFGVALERVGRPEDLPERRVGVVVGAGAVEREQLLLDRDEALLGFPEERLHDGFAIEIHVFAPPSAVHAAKAS